MSEPVTCSCGCSRVMTPEDVNDTIVGFDADSDWGAAIWVAMRGDGWTTYHDQHDRISGAAAQERYGLCVEPAHCPYDCGDRLSVRDGQPLAEPMVPAAELAKRDWALAWLAEQTARLSTPCPHESAESFGRQR